MAKEKRDTQKGQQEDEFQPKGTIILLVLMFLMFLVLWGSVYVILLSRGVTV